jgi:hypothetical protein
LFSYGSTKIVDTIWSAGAGIGVRAPTLKWRYLFWTTFEAGAGGGGAGPFSSGEQCRNAFFFCGSRAGFPLAFGSRGQHQFKFGLALGVSLLSNTYNNSQQGTDYTYTFVSFSLSPSVEYLYKMKGGHFFIGVSIKPYIGLAGGIAVKSNDSSGTDSGIVNHQVIFSIPIGWGNPLRSQATVYLQLR